MKAVVAESFIGKQRRPASITNKNTMEEIGV